MTTTLGVPSALSCGETRSGGGARARATAAAAPAGGAPAATRRLPCVSKPTVASKVMAAGSETSLAPALPSRLIERNFSFVGSRSEILHDLDQQRRGGGRLRDLRGHGGDDGGVRGAGGAVQVSVALPPVIVIALIVLKVFFDLQRFAAFETAKNSLTHSALRLGRKKMQRGGAWRRN